MLDDIQLIGLSALRSRHASERLGLIAGNVANADTPGYLARDLEGFEDAVRRLGRSPATTAPTFVETHPAIPGAQSPNGNNVALEDQMSRASRAMRDHETATLIYSKALDFLRSALGRKG
ncbi:MAG: flagellar biosynthesis protein FlgB [Parvularculaceae bacterium]